MEQYTSETLTQKIVDRFWSKIDKSGECWEWTGSINKPGGYGTFWPKPRPSSRVSAHRFSWVLHFGLIPCGAYILHHCDNPRCVNPDHLFLGNDAINQSDKVSKGRQSRGERVPSAKLTCEDVRSIRRRSNRDGISNRKIAKEFGIGFEAVNRIMSGKTWKSC